MLRNACSWCQSWNIQQHFPWMECNLWQVKSEWSCDSIDEEKGISQHSEVPFLQALQGHWANETTNQLLYQDNQSCLHQNTFSLQFPSQEMPMTLVQHPQPFPSLLLQPQLLPIHHTKPVSNKSSFITHLQLHVLMHSNCAIVFLHVMTKTKLWFLFYNSFKTELELVVSFGSVFKT